jgi:ribosomal 50S subunit-recycling heat shock protein
MDQKYLSVMLSTCTRRSALLGGTGLLLAGFGGSRAALAQSSEPLKIKGQVKVDGKRAESTQQVKVGQEVTVSPGGSAAFAVGNDAFIVKGQERGARLQIEGKAQTVDRLRLVSGGLVATFGKGPERKIVTTSASIGIRGTGCYVESQMHRSYICYCYGRFAFTSRDDQSVQEDFEATYHDAGRFMLRWPRPRIIAAGGLGHDDDDLILAESLVGRKPPFVRA